MAQINLLPWREARRQKQKKQYLSGLLLLAILVGALFWFIGQTIEQQISFQNQRNTYLKNEIAILDAQIAEIKRIRETKNAIEQRMALIEQLQASRNLAPHIFDELARIVPPGVSFRKLRRSGNSIFVEGVSESNNRLAEFMRNLDSSSVFSAGELSSIVSDTQSSDAVSEFSLTFRINSHLLLAQAHLGGGKP